MVTSLAQHVSFPVLNKLLQGDKAQVEGTAEMNTLGLCGMPLLYVYLVRRP